MNRISLFFASIGNYIILLFTSFDANALNQTAITYQTPGIDFTSQFDELIKIFFSILGGIVSTILLNLLKRKFPEFFRLLFSEDTKSG